MSEIKCHPFFKSVNWVDIYEKKVKPPYLPEIDITNLNDLKPKKGYNVNAVVADDF